MTELSLGREFVSKKSIPGPCECPTVPLPTSVEATLEKCTFFLVPQMPDSDFPKLPRVIHVCTH